MANHPWIDETRAPLLVVAPPNCTDAEVDQLFRACDAIYVGLTRDVAWVLDPSETVMVSAKARRLVVDHLRRNSDVMNAYVAGIAVVIPNSWLRGVFTAITWMVQIEFPHAIVDTREAGVRWAQQALTSRSGARASATACSSSMGSR